ncbi:hypothetical protein GCM10025780_08310 [Frondihabitans cladoniiphilus]|uniref:Uncharacterized protein n=2 Tax=Frondihabitans cladoniiphilus TaxID=715785 RepID=A0ABP8VMW2_9MICO
MSAAAVCGQFSAYLTVETNAVLDEKNGAVSQTVEAALLASVDSGMKGASSSNSGVQAAQTEIADALDLPNTTAPGLPYDPDAKAYRSAQYHLNEACNAAGAPMSIHVNTGG